MFSLLGSTSPTWSKYFEFCFSNYLGFLVHISIQAQLFKPEWNHAWAEAAIITIIKSKFVTETASSLYITILHMKLIDFNWKAQQWILFDRKQLKWNCQVLRLNSRTNLNINALSNNDLRLWSEFRTGLCYPTTLRKPYSENPLKDRLISFGFPLF